MDPASRRLYYNRCHPFDTLEPGDDRYVDIDAIDPEHPVRGEDWVARLARGSELSNRPVYELFTGLPGSGKSTELRRLVQRLQSKHQLLPVLIDGEAAIDLSNPIDIPDIYFAILHHADAKVLELEGRSATAAMHEGYLLRFWNWITTIDVTLKGAEFARQGRGEARRGVEGSPEPACAGSPGRCRASSAVSRRGARGASPARAARDPPRVQRPGRDLRLAREATRHVHELECSHGERRAGIWRWRQLPALAGTRPLHDPRRR